MRADALDQLLTRALEQPVKLSWEGGVAESLRGRFEGVRLEVAGLATAWLPLERVVVRAKHARFTAGLPANLRFEEPVVSIRLAQRDLDRWLDGYQLPFRLRLEEKGLVVNTEIAGLAISEFEAALEVWRGWFVLRPRRASLFGFQNHAARLFQAYLPLPPLSPEARLAGIEHEPGHLTLHFGIDTFDEDLTPGLARRVRRRLLPWTG